VDYFVIYFSFCFKNGLCLLRIGEKEWLYQTTKKRMPAVADTLLPFVLTDD